MFLYKEENRVGIWGGCYVIRKVDIRVIYLWIKEEKFVIELLKFVVVFGKGCWEGVILLILLFLVLVFRV